MLDGMFKKLPDTRAYLHRLEMDYPKKLSLEYLDSLIYAHQTHVVFENLDSWYYHRYQSLEIGSLFEKIVLRKRGGYCFELNALFHALLQELGYRPQACMCRILEGEAPEKSMVMHRAEIVAFDEELYFCDVGFGGPSPAGAIRIAENERRCICGEIFSLERYGRDWWTLKRISSRGKEEPILQFYTMEQSPVDFLPLHYYCCINENSEFVQIPLLNLRTKTGSLALTGSQLTVRENGVVKKEQFDSEEDMLSCIQNYFSLSII